MIGDNGRGIKASCRKRSCVALFTGTFFVRLATPWTFYFFYMYGKVLAPIRNPSALRCSSCFPIFWVNTFLKEYLSMRACVSGFIGRWSYFGIWSSVKASSWSARCFSAEMRIWYLLGCIRWARCHSGTIFQVYTRVISSRRILTDFYVYSSVSAAGRCPSWVEDKILSAPAQ